MMRLSLLIVVGFCVAWSVVAHAEPKVAVAPLEGDADGKVDALVREAAAANAKVTPAKAVTKALKDLQIKNPDTEEAAKRLRKKLQVDAVIYGKLEPDGTRKKLSVKVYTRGKKLEKFSIEYKAASSKAFKDGLRDALATRLAPEGNEDEDAEPEHTHTVAKTEPKTETADTTNETADGDEESTAHVHKRAHHTKDGNRDLVTEAAAFVDVGTGGMHRTLDYVTKPGGTKPPHVGTGAVAVQFDGELYPGSFSTLEGPAAAIGLYANLTKAAALSIAIPGATQSAGINETTYTIGVRYRFVFGKSSFAAGLGYWNESFVADRSTLLTPAQLNMPDTSYSAIAPNALLRLAASPQVGVTLEAALPLMLSSGAITEANEFGAATVLTFAVQAGVDYALARNYGLHFAGYFDQESLKFQGGMLTTATDRTMGVSAAFAVMY